MHGGAAPSFPYSSRRGRDGVFLLQGDQASRLKIEGLLQISREQFGFMPGRSTTDAIFMARLVMEKYREKRRPRYLASLDLEKAFDRLPRQVLLRAFRERNVPEHLISLFRNMYDGSPHNSTHSSRPDRSNRRRGWSTPGISSKPVPLPTHAGCHHKRAPG
ncbi:hypothetical protein V3C99_017131 [Haemonchus contortus]